MTERIVWTTSKAQLFRVIDYTSYTKSRNVKEGKGKKGKLSIRSMRNVYLALDLKFIIIVNSSHKHV